MSAEATPMPPPFAVVSGAQVQRALVVPTGSDAWTSGGDRGELVA
jgi:hypothetical protein